MFSIRQLLINCTTYKSFSVQNCARLFLGLPKRVTTADWTKKPVKLAHLAYGNSNKSGDSVPIIILHGLLGSKNNWNSIAKALVKNTNGRMVITLDVRNHGDSPHTDEFSYELMVEDLMKFLKDNNIKKASFIGHSMGGRICMLFALKNPYFVENLVVVDISPVGESPNMLQLPKLFDVISHLEIDPNLGVKGARIAATAQLKNNNVDDQLISFLMTNLVEHNTSWRWKFNINSIKRNFKSEISKFPFSKTPCLAPTLFVAGGESDYIQKEDEPAIKGLFQAARFVYIPGSGHWVHAEKPQEFLSVVSDFLNSVKN